MFFGLSDEQRRFVQTVRDLAQREFRPRATQYMDGTFPWENMRALGELGVLGMAVSGCQSLKPRSSSKRSPRFAT